MLENDGVATLDLVKGVYPDDNRRKKGAFAVVECFQNIPCNPCFSSCPRGAILPMADICDLPKVDFDKCNGCGICASCCPGLAIFIIDETFSEDKALIKLPYEFLPLPEKGAVVAATDRAGKKVCDATVQNVVSGKMQNRTPIVSLSVPKKFSPEVRCFTMENSGVCADGKKVSTGKAPCACSNGINNSCLQAEKLSSETPDNTYICRCEEITAGTIKELINKGYTTLDEIKRVCRAGMGACQGRTCRQLIMNEIAAATGQKQETQLVTTFRPTVTPIKMALLCGEDNAND